MIHKSGCLATLQQKLCSLMCKPKWMDGTAMQGSMFWHTEACRYPHLLLLGSIVQLCEERPEQRLARLPAAEGV